jgi:hypothetical protein
MSAIKTVIENIPELHTKKIENTLYLYDESNSFICQASSIEQLAESTKELGIVKIFYNDDYIWVVDGVIIDETEIEK